MPKDNMKLTQLRECANRINEMTIASEKSSSGKKVEWTNYEGVGHSITVNGMPVHSGFVDRKSAARIYAKHLSDK
jgi:plastocyanin